MWLFLGVSFICIRLVLRCVLDGLVGGVLVSLVGSVLDGLIGIDGVLGVLVD